MRLSGGVREWGSDGVRGSEGVRLSGGVGEWWCEGVVECEGVVV